MQRRRVLRGWKLWASVGVTSYAFFLAAFGLAKIFSPPGGRWNISWAAVVWVATGAALVVSLGTFLDSGKAIVPISKVRSKL
jgi:hypothetical protein